MRRAIKFLIYCFLIILLTFAIVEIAACHRYRNLDEINMTGIGEERFSLKIGVRKTSELDRLTERTSIPFYAKEGPFWFTVNKTFTDLQIGSCRNTGIMVVYSYYEVPSENEKEKLLHMLKMKYRDQKEK